jgi:16S rRNA (cytosine967-C5)-methyltransferase
MVNKTISSTNHQSVQRRKATARLITKVLRDHVTIEDALNQEIFHNESLLAERGWIFECASQVVRYHGRITFILKTYCTKKPPTGNVLRYLEMGIAQLLTQSVEPAKIVSETVDAIKVQEGIDPAKFANAVLRRVCEQVAHWRSWSFPEKEHAKIQASWASQPQWLWDRIVKQKGLEFAKNFAVHSLDRPKIYYRKMNGESIELPDGYQGTEPAGIVQDLGNQQLIDWAAVKIKKHFSGRDFSKLSLLDLCSAPGGKSIGLTIAGLPMITATDRSADRLMKVHENVNRLQLAAKINILAWPDVYDALTLWDLIWVDAPCSSTGIIQRHPEIKWNRGPSDVQNLLRVQNELIDWAKKHVKPGGLILYSVCSMLNEEIKPATDAGLKVLDQYESDATSVDGLSAVLLAHS